VGAYGLGKVPLRAVEVLERRALTGPGTCSAMFTANTMSAALEALGLSPPGTASHPALERGAEGPSALVSQVTGYTPLRSSCYSF
jgi:dihydroxy-acid dehydratase